MLPLNLAKRHHPILAAGGWSANTGPRPTTTRSSDLGFVLPAYETLLQAKRSSPTFDVGNARYMENANRTLFELKHLKTSSKDCQVFPQSWII
ncbi:hypothetical protein CcaCcLH18_03063 [Colletotrichum camelliae]|nr:hypothetical protein CcaCcLH18_03063 [Colletotrichum camelliae]